MNDQDQTNPSAQEQCELACVCKKQLEQVQNNLFHIAADFENFKRRTEKERISWMFNAQAQIIGNFLSIVDDFDRALSNYNQDEAVDLSMMQGIRMIYDSLQKMLEQYGVTEIETTGKFDPEKHEAVAQIEDNQQQPGTIVAVLQRGFTFKDRVLRPAKVTVAK